MRRISTHILDLVYGKPASGVPVRLEKQIDGDWKILNSELTDQDGRCAQLLRESEEMSAAVYRLIFDTGSYYARKANQHAVSDSGSYVSGKGRRITFSHRAASESERIYNLPGKLS